MSISLAEFSKKEIEELNVWFEEFKINGFINYERKPNNETILKMAAWLFQEGYSEGAETAKGGHWVYRKMTSKGYSLNLLLKYQQEIDLETQRIQKEQSQSEYQKLQEELTKAELSEISKARRAARTANIIAIIALAIAAISVIIQYFEAFNK